MRLRVLLLLLVGVLFAAAGCGGGEETSPLPETVEGTVEGGETTTGETTTGETTTGETETEGGQGNAEAGAKVFASAGCGGCHTLEAAGSSGTVGPNLDQAKPDHALVVERVTNGMGAMPSFKDQLSEQQIQDVAAYVVASAG
jgi:mono/diheme cytochrome c family protein